MTDDPGIPDDLTPEMVKRLAELADDDTVDFDSRQRQPEGWLKVYVECPDCEVPMARTSGEGLDEAQPGSHRRSRTDIRAICPECREMETVLTVYRTTKRFDEEYVPPDPGPPHTDSRGDD